jgi:hydroxyquinol 1,2-dioxygenase
MLVDAITNRKPAGATESTVLGPFYVEGAPDLSMGDNISQDEKGEPCVVEGCVVDTEGKPIAGAVLDVWQASHDGFYNVQQPDTQPEMNLRGRFTTGTDGRYWFRSILPRSYPIPDD